MNNGSSNSDPVIDAVAATIHNAIPPELLKFFLPTIVFLGSVICIYILENYSSGGAYSTIIDVVLSFAYIVCGATSVLVGQFVIRIFRFITNL